MLPPASKFQRNLRISYQSKASPNLKTVFIITRKAVSSILIVVDSVRPYKLVRPLVTWRRASKNKQLKLSQNHPIAVHCIRDDIDSSCFSVVHKS